MSAGKTKMPLISSIARNAMKKSKPVLRGTDSNTLFQNKAALSWFAGEFYFVFALRK